jgi:hypothetical protein
MRRVLRLRCDERARHNKIYLNFIALEVSGMSLRAQIRRKSVGFDLLQKIGSP